MNEIEYISTREWAAQCGVSNQRIHQVLSAKLVPGVIAIRRKRNTTYAIPKGTPLPKSDFDIPDGYLSIADWAKKVGKTKTAANQMFAMNGPPEGTIRVGNWRYAVPENAAWTYRKPGQRGRSKSAEADHA
jgi:hypothetical protein